MFSHITVGSNDLEQSRKFYDALLAPLGVAPGMVGHLHTTRVFYSHNGAMLILTGPLNGEPATVSNGATIGFAAASPAQVDAWHAAGVANGGATCEDPPGLRETPLGAFYLAYLRDPDGNKLCGFHPVGN
ncbi:VOC family protein [Camelimonas fluminis]|uniref:VOC family protein n=1 Tax=Camelimonas fluminis TaxID=1576911 RepID=A0ABV7UFS5_9HYPH|nr:VOC family protein [Camelimonas fluminis]